MKDKTVDDLLIGVFYKGATAGLDYPKIAKPSSGYIESEKLSLLQAIEGVRPKDKTWGGYDGEDIVDDREAFGYNQALADYKANIERLFK